MKIRFTRNTTPQEDAVEHKEGDTLDVNQASADRWLRRGAAEIVNGNPAPTPKADKPNPKPKANKAANKSGA